LEFLEKLELQVLLEAQDRLELPELLVLREIQETRERLVSQAAPDQWEVLEVQDSLVPRETRAEGVSRESVVPREMSGLRDQLAQLG